MEQPDLFTAFAQRDEALERVDRHADDTWKATVEAVVIHLARMRPTFTADDVWAYLAAHHDVSTHEPRALGAVLQKLTKSGKIKPTGGFAPSKRRHAAPIRLWSAA
jgi:hypothetical protein